MIAELDLRYLTERWPGHTVHQDGAGVAVILPGYRLPAGFLPQVVELLLRLPFGFPDSQPDMFWVYPHVTVNGRPPDAASLVEQMLGRAWQRFSRHLPPGMWRPGVDNLQSYMALIATMLEREAAGGRVAA
jgi:hypothetical protein